MKIIKSSVSGLLLLRNFIIAEAVKAILLVNQAAVR